MTKSNFCYILTTVTCSLHNQQPLALGGAVMQRFLNIAGTSLGAIVAVLTTGSLLAPALAGDRVTYSVALETLGQEVITDQTCITSSRTLDEMGITAVEGVSQEAIWAVSSVIDCWTVDQVSGTPTDLEYYGTQIEILGSYEMRVGEVIRVFASVLWSDNNHPPETRIMEFLLQPAGGSGLLSIEYFQYEDPSKTLRILADEGWQVEDLLELFQALRPFGDNELEGLEKIGDHSLRAAVEAIYATDAEAVPGERVTEVTYITFAAQRAVVKVDGPSGPWILAVNLEHELLNFTYLREGTQATRVAEDLNISEAEAREILAVARS